MPTRGSRSLRSELMGIGPSSNWNDGRSDRPGCFRDVLGRVARVECPWHKLVRVLNLVDFAGRSNLCTPRPQAAPAPQVVVPADNSLERESRDLL